MGEYIENKLAENKIKFTPCIKCGSENIIFGDCGYSSFNVAYARCNDCKNEITISPCAWNFKIKDIIKVWNENNDPLILKDKYLKQIEAIQKLINNLPIS